MSAKRSADKSAQSRGGSNFPPAPPPRPNRTDDRGGAWKGSPSGGGKSGESKKYDGGLCNDNNVRHGNAGHDKASPVGNDFFRSAALADVGSVKSSAYGSGRSGAPPPLQSSDQSKHGYSTPHRPDGSPSLRGTSPSNFGAAPRARYPPDVNGTESKFLPPTLAQSGLLFENRMTALDLLQQRAAMLNQSGGGEEGGKRSPSVGFESSDALRRSVMGAFAGMDALGARGRESYLNQGTSDNSARGKDGYSDRGGKNGFSLPQGNGGYSPSQKKDGYSSQVKEGYSIQGGTERLQGGSHSDQGGLVAAVSARGDSPPTKRHLHTHHHTHVINATYPHPTQYPHSLYGPYAASLLAASPALVPGVVVPDVYSPK